MILMIYLTTNTVPVALKVTIENVSDDGTDGGIDMNLILLLEERYGKNI